jgi:hypothetical protein
MTIIEVGIAASLDMRQACLAPRNDRTNNTKVYSQKQTVIVILIIKTDSQLDQKSQIQR